MKPSEEMTCQRKTTHRKLSLESISVSSPVPDGESENTSCLVGHNVKPSADNAVVDFSEARWRMGVAS